MNIRLLLVFLCVVQTTIIGAQTMVEQPLSAVTLIANKLVEQTPFRYCVDVAPKDNLFDKMQFVDFGRTFSNTPHGVAYAYTTLRSDADRDIVVEIDHNDALKIWLNTEQIYSCKKAKKTELIFDERSIRMPIQINMHLKKGVNTLLLKSANMGSDRWTFYMQPTSLKGAIVDGVAYAEIGLKGAKDISENIAALTPWLVIGAFEGDIDSINEPEKGVVFGKMYNGLNNSSITWTIPKIEILGCLIDSKEWGTNYDWNYHNGGVAWAMAVAAEALNNPTYLKYADDFCNFHLDGEPFVKHQSRTLNYVNSANHFFIKTPLLDFTLAPSIPFIYRLRSCNDDFKNREGYKKLIDGMLEYSHEQIRFPGTNVYTRVTPQEYTTWVDDMFMGIPFLVQASLYVKDAKQSKAYLDDAASQVVNFTKHVWDKDAKLYMHANYSQTPDVKLPHWSRANGWAIWSMTEVLKVLPQNHPLYKTILEQYRTHVASLVKLQNDNGFWYNVLEYPDSREEVSGTAIFTMAIARGVTNGWLNAKTYAPVAQKGWSAVTSRIDDMGNVYDICYGTMCTEDVNYYKQRPFYTNDTHGLFAVMFAGIEMNNMNLKNKKQ